MTVNLKQFTRELDKLLRHHTTSSADPALQTAAVLLTLNFDSEVTPPERLRAQWIARTKSTVGVEKEPLMQTLRTRPVLVVVLTLLAILLLTSVAYAIGKVLGYIPGVGIVDQSRSLRILAEPVAMERDGLTVTVSEVVADTDHTLVAYTVDGLIVPAKARLTCGARPSLQLPDGSPLRVVSVGDDGPRGGWVLY